MPKLGNWRALYSAIVAKFAKTTATVMATFKEGKFSVAVLTVDVLFGSIPCRFASRKSRGGRNNER